MCVNYKLCVKLHKGPFAFNMEKFLSLEKFYTHAVTGVTDNYQVCVGDLGSGYPKWSSKRDPLGNSAMEAYTLGHFNHSIY